MDIQLPDMDGYEVTRRLRESHKELPPIIALTANVFADPQHFLDKGIDDAISKPLSLASFNDMLERHFSENAPSISLDHRVGAPEQETSEITLFNEVMLKELMEFLPMSVMLDNVKLFETLMPEYLSILDSHMVAKNQKGIVSKSHKIKGAAGSVGLKRIQSLANKVQSPDLPAWWNNIDDWVELIKLQYQNDIIELKRWIVAYKQN